MSSFLTYLIIWLILHNCIYAQLNDSYLTHYWPIENNQMNDQIGMAHMTQGYLARYGSDRFGCPNSALDLNGGWTRVPDGFYFVTSVFSISVWVLPHKVEWWARVIDMSNRFAVADNVILSLDSSGNHLPAFCIFLSLYNEERLVSNKDLIENKWQHLAATFNGTTMSIYIDGILTGINSFAYQMPKIIRTKNYIGKSWSSLSDGSSWSNLDDLKFFNKSLSNEEIISLVNLPGIDSLFLKKVISDLFK
jgi:hypothetical protein